MRKFEIKHEFVDTRFSADELLPKTLVWKKKYQGWMIDVTTKAVDFAVLSRDEYYKFAAGEVKHIFPQYDPQKHTVDVSTYSPEYNDYNNHHITLNEIQEKNENMPFGCFVFKYSDHGSVYLKRIHLSTDKYVDIGSPVDLYKDYTEFRNNKDKFVKLGRRPRKAALLYGSPGNSKTMEICKLAKHAEEDKYRVFFLGNDIRLPHLIDFKEVLEHEDNVFVLEEITERTRESEELLSFLDGEMSWNNCYTIATTNNPEELALNLLDRPSRFKLIKEFPSPNKAQRMSYLQKVGFPEADIEQAATLTEGYSLDYLINVAFDAMLDNLPIVQVINSYKDERRKLSKTFKGKIGIS